MRGDRHCAGGSGILVLILGCAPGHPPWEPIPTVPVASTVADSTLERRDSAASLEANLRGLDSVRVPAQYAAQLYLLTLDNFLAAAPDDPRVPEVRMWKAHHLYNQREYAAAIREYRSLIEGAPGSPFRAEADRMIAQAFERQGKHDQAEAWYRRMLADTNAAVRGEAQERIAQSIYLRADAEEKAGRFRPAEEAYARVSGEFPRAEIAPVALFNAGVMAERRKDWPAAIVRYQAFFTAYYASDLLPKVLFREAKCRELAGEFRSAGEKYRALAQAHPHSAEAEQAQYGAGFAFRSAGSPEEAARAFEEYAERHPDRPEAPNLLSRAVEAYGELKDWRKVAEIQTRFARRYGGDKSRLVQALSMGGVSAWQQENEDEARRLSRKAWSEFARIKSPDATARYYAAQARQTLGDMDAARMRSAPIRPGSREADLKAKRLLLRTAVEQYLGAMELKIADVMVRAGFGLGEAFRVYGEQSAISLGASGSPRERLEAEENRLFQRLEAYGQAAPQYVRVLQVAAKQGINNRQVEDSRATLPALMDSALRGLEAVDAALEYAFPFGPGTLEEALSLRLSRAQRAYQAQRRALDWLVPLWAQASGLGLDAAAVDFLGRAVLRRFLKQGSVFREVASAAQSAPPPAAYDSIQVFFYRVKLAKELLPSVEARAAEIFSEGLRFAAQNGLMRKPEADALRDRLGLCLFGQARALDGLALRALGRPPIPAGLPDAQRKAYEKKFEEMGYALRDSAVTAHRNMVESASRALASPDWAARSFAALLRVEPDRWASGDTASESPWRFPWNKKQVSEAELDSLRNLPFSQPDFFP